MQQFPTFTFLSAVMVIVAVASWAVIGLSNAPEKRLANAMAECTEDRPWTNEDEMDLPISQRELDLCEAWAIGKVYGQMPRYDQ